MTINNLDTITSDAIEAAREVLVVGAWHRHIIRLFELDRAGGVVVHETFGISVAELATKVAVSLSS